LFSGVCLPRLLCLRFKLCIHLTCLTLCETPSRPG
jgi:hypothetical protein